MGLYSYQGKTSHGKVVKGNIEAASETEARVKLRAQRIIPVKVLEKTAANAAQNNKSNDLFALLGLEPKVKSKELQIFTRQFSTLINSGIPIVQSIDILLKQAESAALKICDVFTSDNFTTDGGLQADLKHLAWDNYFELFDHFFTATIGFIAMSD